jgi:rubrerythrin
MPEFGNPFAGQACDRKLSRDELIRALRFNVAAEYEAVQLYMQLAESIDDPLAIKVLKDVANEELEHVGEFLTLIRHLSPEEESFYRKGEAEVQEMMEELGMKPGIRVPSS